MEKPNVGDRFICKKNYGHLIGGTEYHVHTINGNEMRLMPDDIFWSWSVCNPKFEEIFQPAKESLFDRLYLRLKQ